MSHSAINSVIFIDFYPQKGEKKNNELPQLSLSPDTASPSPPGSWCCLKISTIWMNFTSRISNLRLTSHDSSCSYVKYSLIDPKAQCIDGTRATFYLRSLPKSSTSKKKWHIHFEGGGWCYSLEHCEYRSTTLLGSSKNYPSCLDMKHLNASYFSSNKAHNPLLYDFNVVYVRYCDGGSFAGNKIHHYNVDLLSFKHLSW